MKADLFLTEEFQQALNDYYYLMNNHYPEKGSLKLVGDRYKLTTDLRTILYRGISSGEKAGQRKKLITESPSKTIAIDGYNVLFTLLNYRLGRFVFVSNDGICRDAGSLFGKIRKESLFSDCATLLIEFLSGYPETIITIFLDSPVSFSRKHRELLYKIANEINLNLEINLVKSADESILSDSAAIIATSDSVVIDNSLKPILDIPKIIIEKKYNYSMIDLGSLITMNGK